MRLDLPLSLCEKPQVPAIAEFPGNNTDRQGAEVPYRVEQTLAAAQLIDALLGPREMLGFFVGRVAQRFRDRWIALGQRLPLVERLGADLADMVHPHQTRDMCLFRVRHLRIGRIRARRPTNAARRGEDGTQGTVKFDDQAVNHGCSDVLR